MTENLSPLEMIEANARLVATVAQEELGREVGYDEDGVRWLDSYIQRLVDQGNVDANEDLCDTLGSFLGTCIIRTYGGAWQDTEHGWAVILDDDLAVFPFNKTLKHLRDGAGDSVLGLYTSIPALIANATESPPEPTKSSETPIPPPRSLIGKFSGLFKRS